MSTAKLAITLTIHFALAFACLLLVLAHMPLLGLATSLFCSAMIARVK